MVFESAVLKRYRGVLGRFAIEIGTYTNAGGDVGGTIVTNLRHVHFMILTSGGGAVIASEPSVDEDFSIPIDSSLVAIVNTLDEDGHWLAIGIP